MHMIAALLLGLPGAAAQEPAAAQGPQAYWRFDETTAGSAANVVAGAPAGTATGATASNLIPALSYNVNPGATPRSLLFDGTNDTVSVPNFGTFTSVTVSAWIYRTGTGAGRKSVVSYKESSGMGCVLSLNESGSTYYPRLWVHINGAWRHAEEAVTIPASTWVHLAGTYDGTTIRLYRDGTEVATGAFAGTMTNTGSQNTGIGSRSSLDQHWFPGNIDDVRIYARALSPQETAVLAAGVPAPALAAPAAGIHRVDLSWTAPAGAVAYTYNVKRAPSGTGAFASIATGLSGTTYSDGSASPGVAYDYAVTAVSAAESGVSNIGTATALFPPPRTNDHDEGLLGDRCACGTARSPSAWPLLLALAAAAALLARARR